MASVTDEAYMSAKGTQCPHRLRAMTVKRVQHGCLLYFMWISDVFVRDIEQTVTVGCNKKWI